MACWQRQSLCLSIDFAFAGVPSKDKSRRADIEGINGETCWLMTQDKFGKIAHGDVRISKAPPITFIDEFLDKCAPVECKNECVFMDQGEELCGCPGILKTFEKHGHQVCMSGSEASHQNPVERHHQTIADAV